MQYFSTCKILSFWVFLGDSMLFHLLIPAVNLSQLSQFQVYSRCTFHAGVNILCKDGYRINTEDSYCQHTYREPIPLQQMLATLTAWLEKPRLHTMQFILLKKLVAAAAQLLSAPKPARYLTNFRAKQQFTLVL